MKFFAHRTLIFLAVVSFYSTGNCAETRDIFLALSRISASKVPKQNVHCEISGTQTSPDDTVVYNDVTVADVFANYVSWSLSDSIYKRQSFKCEGKNIQKCSWEYGESSNPKNPGWQMFLNFDFNSKTGQIVPASLECVQVP